MSYISRYLFFNIFLLYIKCLPAEVQILQDGGTETNIIGGHFAVVGDCPYQVLFMKNGEIFGSGSIISKNYVLTSAHCCENFNESNVAIGAGVTDKGDTENMMVRTVAATSIHQYYSNVTNGNDICLIKVKEPFTFSKRVKMIPLNKLHLKKDTPCSVSGWGYWKEDDKGPHDQLKIAKVPIADITDCSVKHALRNLTVNADSMICAGHSEGSVDACKFDTGGPLICNKRLAGIVSWGARKCGEPGVPGVYTNVSYFIKWIKLQMVSMEMR